MVWCLSRRGRCYVTHTSNIGGIKKQARLLYIPLDETPGGKCWGGAGEGGGGLEGQAWVEESLVDIIKFCANFTVTTWRLGRLFFFGIT